MKIKHEKSILLPDSSDNLISHIECISWSPSVTKLAVCNSTNNQVILFDGLSGEKKEKFALKSSGKQFSKKSFVVKGIAFSPDSTKLAVGQTDCVIYVYRIGDTWGEKKSIVGKYTVQSPVTCLQWHNCGLIFGCADGKVKVIPGNSTRMVSVFSSNSMVIGLTVADSTAAASYLNGVILVGTVGNREQSSHKTFHHSCPAFAICLTSTGYLCAGGCDGRISFTYLFSETLGGNNDSSRQVVEHGIDISCAAASASGNMILVCSLDKLIIFTLQSKLWKQTQVIELDGARLLTSILWSKDGTKLVVGSVVGSLDLFSCEWKKRFLGDKHEINYVGLHQIVIKNLDTSATSVYKSNYEIKDVKIIRNNFVVIWTTVTLIVGSLNDTKNRYSEIEWSYSRLEADVKFCFDYELVVLVYVVGELHIVEIGQNSILASVRTDFVNPHLMSVRINERNSGAKVLAYLLDLKTICILDLLSGIQMCNWSHTQRIDWLELNETGKKLLFRDKSLKLHLLDILTQESIMMLNLCGFVQWVPGSDVIVAQSHEKLYIWYNISKPVIHEFLRGSRTEATGIVREGGTTRVTLNGKEDDVILDEMLIEFDTSLEDGDLQRAMSFLESCDLSSEAESMWRTLGKVALAKSDLLIAERCFAAVGDVTRAAYIKSCLEEPGKLALLEQDWATFESTDFQDAIDTYIRLYKWTKAIDLASRWGRYDVKEDLEKKYYSWLLETGQEAEAGLLMEKAGNLEEAIKLYVKSGRAVQAASAIIEAASRRSFAISLSLIESVINELKQSKFYEEAGSLYELPSVNNHLEALNCYTEAKAFDKAINLARKHFPDEVVKLEGQYAEYLFTQTHDPGAAVNHFIEAGNTEKALEAAIKGSQFDRAAEIASILDNIPTQYGKLIGDYYSSKDQIDTALEMYLTSGCVREAVSMLNSRGQYSRAYKLAKKLMEPEEAIQMYQSIAKGLENEGKLKEAERIYITCDDVDSAISMYKVRRQFDPMIRLVKQYHPDLLNSTHLHLAKELESEGAYNQAETHYVAASEWKTAVQMYKNNNKWEEAYRVARTYGGAVPAKQVAFLWAKSLKNVEEAVSLLSKFGLLHQVIDYAVECNAFEFARGLVLNSGVDMKHKLKEVSLKYALYLEDEGAFEEAEQQFIECGKAKEAVLMYVHNGSFSDALRVAEQHVQDESCVSDVLVAQAKHTLDRGGRNIENMMRAEGLLIRAGRIELAVKMYKDNEMWEEALRVCEQYAPSLANSIRREMASSGRSLSTDSRSATRTIMSSEASERLSQRKSLDDEDTESKLDFAEKSGDRQAVLKNALLLASEKVKDKMPFEALKVLSKYPSVFLMPESRKILSRIAIELFAFEHNIQSDGQVWKTLRDSILQIVSSSNSDSDVQTLEKYLMISHYFVLKEVLFNLRGQAAANELHFKLTVALLRYTDVIRVDKAFYEAGKLAKENDRLEMAFVFWNHFLDLVDAIEEGELNVDHSDFVGTDIPYEVPLPAQPFFVETDPTILEDVKSWILQISMDTEVSQSLPVDPLREGDIYEASLINFDTTVCLPCLVTGYPVTQHKMLELQPGKYAVNKDDWNKLLMLTKVSNSEDLKEVLHFVGKLCGNATVARFSFQ